MCNANRDRDRRERENCYYSYDYSMKRNLVQSFACYFHTDIDDAWNDDDDSDAVAVAVDFHHRLLGRRMFAE